MSDPAPVDALVHALSDVRAGSVLVVTGAGVSLASGVPTFRGSDPDAVWANDVMEKGTYSYFMSHPADSWNWYLDRFGGLRGLEPNPSHDSLVALERWHLGRGGDFLLVTQNVDGLHRAAGSQELVEVHGRADRVRCANDGCKHAAPRGSLAWSDDDFAAFRAEPSKATLPQCPACSSLLRPHVLWFDETYDEHAEYQFARVMTMAGCADVVLFAGTSFSVGVTDLVLERALARRVPTFSIDPSARSSTPRMTVIREPAEVALAAVAKALT